MDEQHATELYLVNDIVCQMSVEGVSYPTVEEVRNHWRFKYDDVTDEEIGKIISDVQRVDEFTRICQMMTDPYSVCSENPDDY